MCKALKATVQRRFLRRCREAGHSLCGFSEEISIITEGPQTDAHAYRRPRKPRPEHQVLQEELQELKTLLATASAAPRTEDKQLQSRPSFANSSIRSPLPSTSSLGRIPLEQELAVKYTREAFELRQKCDGLRRIFQKIQFRVSTPEAVLHEQIMRLLNHNDLKLTSTSVLD